MKVFFAALLLVGTSLTAQANIGGDGGQKASEYWNQPSAWLKSNKTRYTSAAQAQRDLELRQCNDVAGGAQNCPSYEARPGTPVDARQADPSWQTERACGYTFTTLRAAAYSCPHVANVLQVRDGFQCDCRELLLRD